MATITVHVHFCNLTGKILQKRPKSEALHNNDDDDDNNLETLVCSELLKFSVHPENLPAANPLRPNY